MPAATMALEMPRPIPLAPPVTNATRSFSVSMCLPCVGNERGALVAGRASLLPAARASVEVALELDVPLARRTRLAFEGRLTEGGQVELVEEVFLVGQVGRPQRHFPVVLRAGPFDARVEQLVGLRAGIRQ